MTLSKEKVIQDFFEDASYRMINVGEKKSTHRIALAHGKIFLSQETLLKIKNKTLEKGDVLPLAEMAGINGAKATSTLLPLCHPLPLSYVSIKTQLNFEEQSVEVYCVVKAFAQTGVEMEALLGVQAALLCIYDLCKMYGHDMCLSDVKLLYKSGGKSHEICYPDSLPKILKQLADVTPLTLSGVSVATLTISDRVSKGVYDDKSGVLLQTKLKSMGSDVIACEQVPDDEKMISAMIESIVNKKKPSLLLTTGGTGVGPNDVTPNAVASLIDYEIAGLGELLRIEGAKHTPYAWLSRSLAGLYKGTLVISLPGSPNAVIEGLDALHGLLPHLLKIIQGGGHA